MKSNFIKVLIFTTLLLVPLATSSWALPYPVSVNDLIHVRQGVAGTFGGQLEIYDSTNTIHLFSTFCVERNEYLDFTHQFRVDSILDVVVKGGLGGIIPAEGGDPLDKQTKWLYWNYVNGMLHDKVPTFVYGNKASDNALQVLFWKIEQELTSSEALAKLSVAEKAIYTALDAGYNTHDGVGDVKALNLKYLNGTDAQSLLVASSVPEPGTMMLLGIGMLGLAVYGKRRMNRES